MTGMILQMASALALVLILIVAMGSLYRRRQKGAGLITMLAYQSLGQKMGIAAVKIGREILVLGVTPNDFKLLKRFDARPEADEESPSRPAVRTGGRLERLRKMKEEIRG